MQGVSLIRSIRPGTWGAEESRVATSLSGPAQAQRRSRRGERIGDVEIAQQRQGNLGRPELADSARNRDPAASSTRPVARTSAAG